MWVNIIVKNGIVGKIPLIYSSARERDYKLLEGRIRDISPESFNSNYEIYTLNFEGAEKGNSASLVIHAGLKERIRDLLSLEEGQEVVGQPVQVYYRGHRIHGFRPMQE